jgi:hypothetical protein
MHGARFAYRFAGNSSTPCYVARPEHSLAPGIQQALHSVDALVPGEPLHETSDSTWSMPDNPAAAPKIEGHLRIK